MLSANVVYSFGQPQQQEVINMRIVIMGSQARSMANFWPTLIKKLVEAGHEVVCFVPDTSEEADRRAIIRLKSWGAMVRPVPMNRRGLNPVADLRSLYLLWQELRRIRPDVFFGYAIKPVIYGTIAAWLSSVPARFAMITGLGYTFEADSLPKRALTMAASCLYKFALKHCKTVFFQNRDDLAHFQNLGILPEKLEPGQIEMLRGTGVDIGHFEFFPPKLSPVTFLLVGRLVEAKGIREFAGAASQLGRDYPGQAVFQILGPAESGPGSIPLDEVKAWAQGGFLEYLGATDDVRPFIREASVMVLPSYREGLPTSVMEGMSMGRPAVVTDVPGCRELVVEGVNGFMVPAKNTPALAEAMEKFVKQPDLIASFGKTGRDMAEKDFDAREVAAKLMQSMGLRN